MTYYYEIETRNGTIEYEYMPNCDEVKNAIIKIISHKTPKEIYNILDEIADDGADLEEYFYDELKDYFEEYAYGEYKDIMASQEPPYRQSDFI